MPARILYVSQTSRVDRPYFDPSVRYRCFNVASRLRDRGLSTWVMSQAEFETSDLPGFDAYVFHRPRLTGPFLDQLRRLPPGAARLADYDDLVFDVAAAEHTSAVRNRGEDIWAVRRALSANQAALGLFRRFTVSTPPLKEAIERLVPGADVLVLPNRPDDGFLALAAEARRARAADPGASAGRVGYFSGTRSHDKDLSSIWRPLAEFCRARGATLVLGGEVTPPQTPAASGVAVAAVKLVGFHKLPEIMAGCDLVIAPLIANHFAACKSGIKLMEAAAVGTPLVATPIPDIDRFDTPLLFRAPEPTDWDGALEAAWARDRAADACHGAAFAAQLDDAEALDAYVARLEAPAP